MTTTINTTKQTEAMNICPKCGRLPLIIMSEDNTFHQLGCAYCGIKEGVSFFVTDEAIEDVNRKLQKEWNAKCINEEYSHEVLEQLDIDCGDYVLTNANNNAIVLIAKDMKTVLSFIDDPAHNYLVKIYVRAENCLECLGNSYLIHLALGRC